MVLEKFKFLQASIHKQQEESGNFFPKKIHFGGNPKLQYREGGEKFHKTEQGRAQKFQKNGQAGANKKFERGEKKFGGEKKNLKGNKRDQKEQGDKKFKNKKVKKGKGDPVKGTSTEYIELANSDDDEDVVDVTDMISKSDNDDNEDEAVIPLLNTSTKRKSVKNAKIPAVVSKFSSKNRFNALGEYEEVGEKSEEPPRKRQRPSEDDGKEAEEEEGAEDVDGESGSDDDEEERLKFREEISKMPIGKVREMKEKLGIKLFNKTYFGTSEVEKKRKETKKAEISRSENHGQHRPKEISSKRHVSTFRNIYGEHEKGTKKK
uniref:Uncharacterized protein n=2 Tax=Caenorhabditis japonica TaxID=281687 RepID=A0A8R1HLJ7_CAEJA